MAGVGFITFGFTESVCGTPPDRFHGGGIGDAFIGRSSVTINGFDYDLSNFKHPATNGVFDGKTLALNATGFNAPGNDLSFMFQNTNDHCSGLITKSRTSSITGTGSNLDWYFPCLILKQDGTSGANLTGYESATNCHVRAGTRSLFKQQKRQGEVYFTWSDVKNPNRNLAVFRSSVL